MKLDKEKLNALIELTKHYYTTHNIDILGAMFTLGEEVFGDEYSNIDDIITGITCRDKSEPYETYYRVLEVLGYEIE